MQHFIFVTITTYGPLMCSIVTTTRKFFTVLASVMVFGHALFAHQWLGTVLVFGGLLLDTLFGKGHGKKPAGGHSGTGSNAANGCSHCSCPETQLHVAGAGDAVDAHAHVDSSADLQATAALAPEAQAIVDPEKRKQLWWAWLGRRYLPICPAILTRRQRRPSRF